jgi:putative acetyltransferase
MDKTDTQDIRAGDFENAQVQSLLAYHLKQMHEHSPPGTAFALDWSGLQKADITFITLWSGEVLMGCGALKELSPQHGELKSMRTHPDHLRKGVARQILNHLVDLAKSRAYRRLSLETGTDGPFIPALTLYQSHGFERGEAFAGYPPSDFNQFFHLELAS